MAIIEIKEIAHAGLDFERLHGAFIDAPKPGDRLPGHDVAIVGWVIGRGSPAVAVELLADGTVLARAPVGVSRSDVAAAFPGIPHAAAAGFALRAAVPAMGSHALHLAAALRSRGRALIAAIRAEGCWQEADSRVGAPLVSVVIPCFDQSRFLSEAIESVLAQSHPNFEIVVVDDGSHDNTAEVANRYRIVHYVRQKSAGLSGARNAGLQHSRGTFVVFLDADDRLLPEALETGLAALSAHPECAFASGQCRHVGFDGVLLPTEPTPAIAADHHRELLRNCYIWMPGVVMFRRLALSSLGAFDTSFGSSADHELYLRIARRHRVLCHDRVIAEYRRHARNMTRLPGTNLKERITVLRRQRAYVRGKQDRAAYREGLQFARRYYGESLVTEVLSDLWSGRWRHGFEGLRLLSTYHRRGAASVLYELVRSILPGRAARKTQA